MAAHETFGRWLKQARKGRGLTQAALADRIGYAVITLRKIEADTLRPSQQLLTRLLEEFSLEAGDQRILLALARSHLPDQAHNLPTPLTALFGRTNEVATLCAMLRGSVRLLTLTGPGGIGKTRLAITIAMALLGDFTNGVFFVNLALVRDPQMVLPAIARVLTVQERASSPLVTVLAHAIHDQQLLLVLDNYEQLLKNAPQLAVLLKAVPGLKILVTSRATLHVSGEQVFPVPPLALPPVHSHTASDIELVERTAQFPAIALFVERARATVPTFALTATNAATISAICARLDGLPLAIELTAVYCRLFTPHQLLERLEQRLEVTASRASTMPARQQTLRATIDWSYQLLEPTERVLLRRLAVFRGGWTLDAAEAVAMTMQSDHSREQHQRSIFSTMEALLDQSLLSYQDQEDGTRRFGMLETIREYTLEQLTESGELNTLRARQSAYYLAVVETAEPQLLGGDQALWLHRMEAEHDNLRAVLTWNLSPNGDPTLALQLAVALWRFWWVRNYFSEGRIWLAAALEAAPTPPTLMHGRALNFMGVLARFQNDLLQARMLIEQSLELFRTLGVRSDIAEALNNLAVLAQDQGNYTLVRTYCNESLALTRDLSDPKVRAWPLVTLGNAVAWDKDYAQAKQLYEEGTALFRAAGDQRGVARGLSYEAGCAKEQHDYDQATALAEASLALFRTLGDIHGSAVALCLLGEIAQAQGQRTQALALIDDSLGMIRELDGQRRIGWVLITKGQLLEMGGDVAAARVCYEESRQAFEQAGNLAGQTLSIFWLGRNAYLQGDHQAAHQLLTIYVSLAQDLKTPRMIAEGICFRDAILAAMDLGQGVAQLEADLSQFRTTDDQWGVCFALRVLGMLYVGAADDRARSYLREGLALAYKLDDRIGILTQLSGLANLWLRHKRPNDAARLCGAIEALEAALGTGYVATAMWPPDRARWTQTRADMRTLFDDPTLAEAWAAGRFATLSEIVEFAQH